MNQFFVYIGMTTWVSVHHLHQVLAGYRGHPILWNLNDSGCGLCAAWCGCWELNQSHLPEQEALLASELFHSSSFLLCKTMRKPETQELMAPKGCGRLTDYSTPSPTAEEAMFVPYKYESGTLCYAMRSYHWIPLSSPEILGKTYTCLQSFPQKENYPMCLNTVINWACIRISTWL